MVYRYEFEKNGVRTGILTGLDDYFSGNEILGLCWIFEMKLKAPDIPMDNTRSYFTEKGHKTFRKAIRNIKKIAAEKNINVICEIKHEKELTNILYKDERQVIIRLGSSDG